MTMSTIEQLGKLQGRLIADEIEQAFQDYLLNVDVDQLAGALDDRGTDHISSQLSIILGLDEGGAPQPLSDAMEGPVALLASFVAAVAALAAAQAKHILNHNGTGLEKVKADAAELLRSHLTETASAISAAIGSAIHSKAAPLARAAQVKRSIGLSVRQFASLEAMQLALQRFVETPKTLTPSRVNEKGVRVPPTYARNANTRAILGATRGRISAAQRQLIVSAMKNPDLTQAQADALLDAHSHAMRNFRIRSFAINGVHQLAEAGKLTGWRIAQRFGALPKDQRRYWRTAGDERVRHSHGQVPGMNPAGVALDQPFATPFGRRMHAPLEWGCRCQSTLEAPR